MPDIDVVLLEHARRFYDDAATHEEREQINQAIARLCQSPAIDNLLTHPFEAHSAETTAIYLDGSTWIIYVMMNAWTIGVIGIGTVEDSGPGGD
ncbi:MAG TPA: hypothetical protein VIH21_10965 [Dehalococcoidia bacterium]